MDDTRPSAYYEIRLRGVLGETLLSAFPALRGESRDGITVLSGFLPDHAALHGVLGQIEALGLELLAMRQATSGHPFRVMTAHPALGDGCGAIDESSASKGPARNLVQKGVQAMLTPALLTPETSAVLLVDYQQHVIEGIHSTDQELVKLNGLALAKATRTFNVPVILSTIGVEMRGDHPTIPSIRSELADEPEYDRTTMNAWEDEAVREAIAKTGRRRLIFAGLWTEVCLLYPVLHAQSEGFETYFVVDAVGGSSVAAHETAMLRMIQAGSQPVTLNAMQTEWIRDWKTTPYTEGFVSYLDWYNPRIESVRERLRAGPELVEAI